MPPAAPARLPQPAASRPQAPPPCHAVVVATDDAYAHATAALAASLAASAAPGRALDLYVLDGGMAPATADRLRRALARTAARGRRRGVDVAPVFLAPDVGAVAGLTTHGHVSSSAYLRLLVPDLLPPTVGRALYLDADVVVRRDVGELFGFDLGGAPAAAAANVTKSTIGTNMRAHGERGLDPAATYVNSGVLVLDLGRWRAERIGEAVLSDLRDHQRLYQFHDQCGLNAVLQGRWAPLPPEWNVQVGSPVTRASPPPLSAVAALHFTGGRKPWKAGYGSFSDQGPTYAVYRSAWLDAAKWSGWYGPAGWARYRVGLAVREGRLRLREQVRRP